MGEGPASVCEGGWGGRKKKNMCDSTFLLEPAGSELMCYVKRLGKDFSGPVQTGTAPAASSLCFALSVKL